MKQKTLKTLLICLFAFAGIGRSYAHDIKVANADSVTIYYNFINNNAELEVTYQGSYSNSAVYTGSIVIPGSVTYEGHIYPVTSIGQYAFYECSGLTEVTIPNSVISIIGDNAFSRCRGLEKIVVESGNPNYDSREDCNVIIQTDINKLIAGCKNTKILNSVTAIGAHAFEYCTGLTELTIPNSVTSIDFYAFSGCI